MLEDKEDDESCKLKLSKHIGKRPPASIVEFTNGSVNFAAEQILHFNRYRSSMESDSANSVKRIMSATNGRMSYSGESQLTDGPLRYFVGVRNKQTGKMKLYDTEFFRLKPILKPPKIKQEKKERNYRRDVDDLVTNFGSKMGKRIVNSRLSRAVDPAHMEASLDGLTIDDSITVSPSVNVADNIDYIPTRNVEAMTPEDVYDIDAIITKDECYSLANEEQKLMNATPENVSEWKDGKVYCKYVLAHIEAGLEDPQKARYLACYNLMATFINYPYTEFRKKSAAFEIPEPFRQRFLEEFTSTSMTTAGRNQRSFPPKMKDKLLSRMIVLALFIDDFSVDSSLIHADVKFSLNHIISVGQILGCYVKKKNSTSSVKLLELRVPLNVFNPKVFRKKNF